MGSGLPPVIRVNQDKCVSCHACIAVCPVKYCNDGSGETVEVDPDLCIGCGTCLTACKHEARYGVDDTDAFLTALQAHAKLVALVAPSAAASFPGRLPSLVGWLREAGVAAVFDVSFGAELSSRAYVEHLRTAPDGPLVAQPCPAIVSFVETYHPELLPYLAPVDSPMGCTAKMVRAFYPEYTDHTLVAISPCLAKKREFEETGLIGFNVGYSALIHHFAATGVDLARVPPGEFRNAPAERAVLFSQPGGLMQTVERWVPGIAAKTRRIEGPAMVYPYLEHWDQARRDGHVPTLVDCLSCDMGCNCGPCTVADRNVPDTVEHWVRTRDAAQRMHYRTAAPKPAAEAAVNRVVDRYWRPDLYVRSYQPNPAAAGLREPTDVEQQEIFRRMHKYGPEDLYNCCACGYFSCESMAMAIFNGKNRPENCHFYLQKETELSHQRTKEREKWLDTIIETSTEGFILVDNEFRIQRINPALQRMLGVGARDLDGVSVFGLTTDAGRAEFARQKAIRAKGQGAVYEIPLVRRTDGVVRLCLMSASPIYDHAMQKVGSFGMVTDITELKKAQDDLRLMQKYLQNIIDSMPSMLIAVDPDGRVTAWNMRAEQETGIAAEAAEGRPLVELYQALAAHVGAVREAIESRVPRRIERLLRAVQAETRYNDVTIYPLIANGVRGAVILVDDVTERVRLQEMMVQTEKMMSVGGLAAGMAHEINNPLGGIMQGAQNVLRRVSPDLPRNAQAAVECGTTLNAIRAYMEKREILKFIEGIRDAGEKAAKIIANMLQFSRRSEAQKAPIDVRELLDKTVELGASDYDLKKKYDFKLIRIEREYGADVPPVPCVATEIEQVLLNLLKNAAQAMHEGAGTPEPTIWLRTVREDGYVRIEVQDNGPGMNEETRRRCMEPFFTTKEVGVGTGLGLSVSFFIVTNNHKGTMEVESTPGRGTKFIIRLPCQQEGRV